MVPMRSLCFAANALELWTPRHGAVLVHDLDDQGRGFEARHARQVDTRFGVAGPPQHAAGFRDQWHMPGLHDIRWLGVRRYRLFTRVRALYGADPRALFAVRHRWRR